MSLRSLLLPLTLPLRSGQRAHDLGMHDVHRDPALTVATFPVYAGFACGTEVRYELLDLHDSVCWIERFLYVCSGKTLTHFKKIVNRYPLFV